MARTKRTTEVIDHSADAGAMTPFINPSLEAERNARLEGLVAQFGDGLPWHSAHYESEIRREMRRGCDAFVRAGGLLVVAKEAASHGEWAGILDRLGLETRQAQRMMEAARRLAALPNASRATHLIEAAGTQSKLIELLSLPDDQFQELAIDGETDGLKVDELAGLSRDELRAKLREAREDIAAKEDRAAKREKEIERLEGNLRKAKRAFKEAPVDEQLGVLRDAVSQCVLALRSKIAAVGTGARGEPVDSLRTHLQALVEHGDTNGDDQRDFAGAAIGELLVELRKLRDHDDLSLPIVNDKAPRA